MGEAALRVAFFPDAYHEVDGVANTSRHFEQFALRRGLPFLTVLGGTKNSLEHDGSVTRLECKRSPIGFPLDKKHDFDLAFMRHYGKVADQVRAFEPDVIHITGPSDVGILGTVIAQRMHIPLAASWHTNVHEYAERRGVGLLPFLPKSARNRAGRAMREASLLATLRFYHIAQVLYAPNQELIDLLEEGTGKPCYLMGRGVDAVLFDPQRRSREDKPFVIGYVGRLTVEKNIHFLAELEVALLAAGMTDFRFLIVGQGAEEQWLKEHMKYADFAGVQKGEDLARHYANMDVFAFPSHTDTYGNVVLEALASGVPAVVTDSGGPRFIVREGETGYVARNLGEFVARIQEMAGQPGRMGMFRASARTFAMSASWDHVFEAVYAGYERGLRSSTEAGDKVRGKAGTVRTGAPSTI